jgi:hypothetical protein
LGQDVDQEYVDQGRINPRKKPVAGAAAGLAVILPAGGGGLASPPPVRGLRFLFCKSLISLDILVNSSRVPVKKLTGSG